MVSVARARGLEHAHTLDIPSHASMDEAWSRVAKATGVSLGERTTHVANHYGLEGADLESSAQVARKILPSRFARGLQVLPLQCTDRSLVVATADPVGLDSERAIARVAGRSVMFQVASPDALEEALQTAYPPDEAVRVDLSSLDKKMERGPHVLVVDDDDETRLLLRSVLETSGYRVEEAADGTDALEKLKKGEPFDLVTLDLTMPDMGGLETLRHIRSNVTTATLPVVVATGSDDPDRELELFEAGADDYIVKPVDPPRFVLRIKAVLRRRHGGGHGL